MLPGEGPQPCLGMVIAEAPSLADEKTGALLTGVAGRVLDSALRSLGVTRRQFYITTLVKNTPLDSDGRQRRPYDVEAEAWKGILEQEIQSTAPRAILALGRTVAKTLTGLEGEIPYGSKIGNVYIAWHPAYVARGAGQEFYDIPPVELWLEQLAPFVREVEA